MVIFRYVNVQRVNGRRFIAMSDDSWGPKRFWSARPRPILSPDKRTSGWWHGCCRGWEMDIFQCDKLIIIWHVTTTIINNMMNISKSRSILDGYKLILWAVFPSKTRFQGFKGIKKSWVSPRTNGEGFKPSKDSVATPKFIDLCFLYGFDRILLDLLKEQKQKILKNIPG